MENSVLELLFWFNVIALLAIGPVGVLAVSLWFWVPAFFRDTQPTPGEKKGTEKDEGAEAQSQKPLFDWQGTVRPRLAVIGIVLALAAGATYYRYLVLNHLDQTAAMFVGIPTLLSILVILSPKSASLGRTVFKVITVGLLMSFVLSWEGYICILMSAPLFYFVGLIIVLVMHRFSNRMKCCALFLLVLMALEGLTPNLTFFPDESVTVSRVVAVPVETLASRFETAPDFAPPLPDLLRIGFPVPLGAAIETRQTGRELVVHFSGGEGRPPGDLRLRPTRTENGWTFTAVDDTSHINHWLTWRGSDIRLNPLAGNRTEVSWTLHFRRNLHPAWYFSPVEKFFVSLSADYLLDVYAGH